MVEIVAGSLIRQNELSAENLSSIVSHWGINSWTYVALVEFIIIIIIAVFVFLLNKKANPKSIDRNVKDDAINDNVDFGNLVNSAFHASELYDKLKVKCHPDRFPNNPEKNAMALEIFQLINKNRNNIKVLEDLKLRAEKDLGITI